ncbi:hypothetical protein B0T18DRAFT_228980 [Schizothecium vesticola]|uniref:Uncharacterized protein n=1 Tax=Schizothecium vesticola TaxID=314040 RepID=A0AA40K0P6_9PEZI|nr:hypothetical protein B0T18DRAFT_228980 [Schizothecium vesticola]
MGGLCWAARAGFVTAIDLSQGSRWVGLVVVRDWKLFCSVFMRFRGGRAVPVSSSRGGQAKGVHWWQSIQRARLTRHVESGQPNEAIPTQPCCLFASDLGWGCDATVTRSSHLMPASPKLAQLVFSDWWAEVVLHSIVSPHQRQYHRRQHTSASNGAAHVCNNC